MTARLVIGRSLFLPGRVRDASTATDQSALIIT
jgi:hypothetical protein